MTADKRAYLQQTFTVVGALSGRSLRLPTAAMPPMPDLGDIGVILNGDKATSFGAISSEFGYPDVRSFRRKFGLLIPSTNTSMEHELWSLIFGNSATLSGVGLHTVTVSTPSPILRTDADIERYKEQFVSGVGDAVEEALLAEPQHLIIGMSLEHILSGLEAVDALTCRIRRQAGLGLTVWHEAANAALKKSGAKRIGLLTPFDQKGTENAARLFTDLGYSVGASVGFSCANALHIAHVPDWAKEKAIYELLKPKQSKLDAIVQCGTNMSFSQVADRVESGLEIPLLGINAILFWYALRETGITSPIAGAGSLLRTC